MSGPKIASPKRREILDFGPIYLAIFVSFFFYAIQLSAAAAERKDAAYNELFGNLLNVMIKLFFS